MTSPRGCIVVLTSLAKPCCAGIGVELRLEVFEAALLLLFGLRHVDGALALAAEAGFSGLLVAWGVSGTIGCTSLLAGARLALAVEPCWAMSLPPGRMLPEKAAFSDFCSAWIFEMLTEEIENSTMNSAISSVIMSA